MHARRAWHTALLILLLSLNRASAVFAGPAAASGTGATHVVILTDQGVVWTWGYNGQGQVGDGTTATRQLPYQVSISGAMAVAAGDSSSYVLKTNGTVWAWGYNSNGQLGDGTTTTRLSPVQVSGLTNVVAIAAGASYALALKGDGTVWAWGQNGVGQLGDGTTTQRTTPVQVTALSTSATAIAATGNHSHALKGDGTVWSWGDNQFGELGDGTNTNRNSPVQVLTISDGTGIGSGNSQAFAWNSSGALKAWGSNVFGGLGDGTFTSHSSPAAVSGMSSGTIAATGAGYFALAAKSDGTVRAWGQNAAGQLGDGTFTNRNVPIQPSGPASIVSVAAGQAFSVAVSSDGRVWTWGDNVNYQLGDGTNNPRSTPIQIADAGFAWRVATPKLNPFGGSYSNTVNVTISCATFGATIHYTTNGVDPTESDPTVASGSVVTITETTTLKAKAWLGTPASNVTSAVFTLSLPAPSFSPGSGTYGSAQSVSISDAISGATIRYTTDGSTPTASSAAYSSPIVVSTATTLKAIAFKTNWTTSGMTTANYVLNYGTLSAPVFNPVPAQVGYGTAVTLTAASGATIRYTTNGTTPTGTSSIYTSPITVTGTVTIYAKAFQQDWTTSLQSGGQYTVKVSTPVFSPDGGTYSAGQTVTITDITPGAVIHYTTTGAAPTVNDPVIASGGTVIAGNYTLKAQAFITGWTSSDVKSATYALSGPFTTYAVAGGTNYTAALKSDGTVWTWGDNGGNQLGDGGQSRSMPAVVNGVTGVVKIAAGTQHMLVLRSDGTVWAWGTNATGQLGDGTTTTRWAFAPVSGLSAVSAIAASVNYSVALKTDGTVWAWGSNASGQLGDGTTTTRLTPTQVSGLSSVAAIAVGDSHTIARKSDGSVWAWGSNAYGQLGDGSTTQRLSPVQVSGLTASAGPWAGSDFSVATTASGNAYAWGNNANGQLSTGGAAQSSTPTLVSGLTNITSADAGLFAIATLSGGSVWTWGENSVGAIGDGTTTNRTTPYQVAGLTVSGVAAGQRHSVVVTSDGSVWAWGNNAAGQVGDGTLDNRLSPVQISESNFNWKTSTPRLSPYGGAYTAVTNVTVTAVSPSAEIHYTTSGSDPTQSDPTVSSGGTVAIDQSMTFKASAWASGMPVSNVASVVFTMSLPTPGISPATGTYQVTQSVTLSTPVAGATIRYTTDGSDPTVGSSAFASAITVDASTTVKAKAFKSGWNDSGIATNTYTMKVVAPAFSPTGGSFGSAQTVTISTSTPSAVVRYTMDGSLPTASSPIYSAPIAVSTTGTIKAFASRAGWGDSDSATASFWFTAGTADTPTLSPVGGSYTGSVFVTLASTTSGATIRYTVDGSDPTLASPIYQWPIAVSSTTTVKARAYKTSFTPSAVASGSYSLDASGAVDTPVIAPAGGRFAAGPTATVTVQASGATVRYTTNGVDPTDTDPVIPVGGVPITKSLVLKVKAWSASASASAVRRADFVITGAVVATDASSHALKGDGTVWSWGVNGSGQIGDGTTTPESTPIAVPGLTGVIALAAGAYHTVVVKADGTVWSWGSNNNYRLGDTSSGRTTPAQVSGLTHIVAVAAGEFHNLALKDDGTVWSWGGNGAGQLGDGTTTDRATPTMVSGLSGVTRIAAGHDFSLAVESGGATGGRVWAWGSNTYGQLGDGSQVMRNLPVEVNGVTDAVAVSGGSDFTMAIRADGTVWSWGHNNFGQLGDGTTIDRMGPVPVAPLAGAYAVAAGSNFAVAVTSDGYLWTWGSNGVTWGYGQLGDGLNADRSYAQPLPGLTGDTAIAAGNAYAFSVQPDGSVKAWGINGSHQLGYVNPSANAEPVPVTIASFSLFDGTWLIGDQDQDSLLTWREYLLGTDPLNADTGGSRIGDRVLVASGRAAASSDIDGDGLSNVDEVRLGTDPFNVDTDGDGVPDKQDAFPLDPSRSLPLSSDPNDHTPPVITLTEPTNAVPVP